jgi:uncharacterized protein (TIGR00730 family)
MLSKVDHDTVEVFMGNPKRNPSEPIPTPQLAYKNDRFLESADARTLRLVAEYLEPQSRLRRAGIQNTVVFFGSARILPRDVAAGKLAELEARSQDGGEVPTRAELRAARRALQMSRYYEEARELARLITRWALSQGNGSQFLVVCSVGGPGIMEAANRGATEAGGKSVGLNIKLPLEQTPNPYITPELNFLFRYFFMRKLWFAQPARALIVFPGGFGTMDELWEFLTLIQTHKMGHSAFIFLYGRMFWQRAINFRWLVESGTVSKEDLNVVNYVDTPGEAFELIKKKFKRVRTLRAALRHPFP